MNRHTSTVSALPVLLIFLVPTALYPCVYVWARATHRLVRLSSGPIVPPDWSGCSDITFESMVFEPATWLEERLRAEATALSRKR